MSWKVNIAEVGKPGRITTGLPSHTASKAAFRFSATPRDDPGQSFDDAMGDVARAFTPHLRHQRLARARAVHRGFQLLIELRLGIPYRHVLGNRRGDDGALCQ
jgi:hypothetical protein